jgi:hypothetical protein
MDVFLAALGRFERQFDDVVVEGSVLVIESSSWVFGNQAFDQVLRGLSTEVREMGLLSIKAVIEPGYVDCNQLAKPSAKR